MNTQDTKHGFSRRDLFAGSVALGAAAVLTSTGASQALAAASPSALPPLVPVPMPQQASAKDGLADVNGAKLWYWDTGGNGQPVVLLHPNSGSGLIWGYQQPVFAKAGYRVIGYSRRNYYKSDPASKENPGIASEDLLGLLKFLGINKAHVVASAAGGSVAAAFAFTHPENVQSLTVSSNTFGVREGEIYKVAQSIRPHIWEEVPVHVRELGPSYRAANPAGVEAWIELNKKKSTGTVAQKLLLDVTTAMLGTLKVPTLVIGADADMSTPASLSRMLQQRIPNSELAIVYESGHSIYWEQPEAFNKAVRDFTDKHT